MRIFSVKWFARREQRVSPFQSCPRCMQFAVVFSGRLKRQRVWFDMENNLGHTDGDTRKIEAVTGSAGMVETSRKLSGNHYPACYYHLPFFILLSLFS